MGSTNYHRLVDSMPSEMLHVLHLHIIIIWSMRATLDMMTNMVHDDDVIDDIYLCISAALLRQLSPVSNGLMAGSRWRVCVRR